MTSFAGEKLNKITRSTKGISFRKSWHDCWCATHGTFIWLAELYTHDVKGISFIKCDVFDESDTRDLGLIGWYLTHIVLKELHWLTLISSVNTTHVCPWSMMFWNNKGPAPFPSTPQVVRLVFNKHPVSDFGHLKIDLFKLTCFNKWSGEQNSGKRFSV